MPASRQAPPPSAKRPDLIAALRLALQAASFTHEHVKAAMRSDDSLQIPTARAPLLLQELGGGPLATLIALFLAYVPVPTVFATRALAPLTLQQAEALGIIGVGRSHVHPQVQIQPTPEGWFASDILDESPEFVMGVSDSTRMLAHTTIRRRSESALDMGTGGGYHAILAAPHAQRVVGVDINARAIAFAHFNAALNSCQNVEFRTGNMFEPVAGQTFDLIVSNPPFVISPDKAFVYRDSGLGGDEVSRTLIQTLPRYLTPNGVGHVTFNWVHQPNEDWDAPLRQWIAGSGCDAWFIREASYDPLAYAMLWNQRLLVDATNKQRY
ncbi:MAG: methyltransferase, partial [Chloroflexi bacterium]|nr:methyltransferase [Chloroflexota bacterium]